ncbi:MAG: hypothetical protein Q9159_003487 [Coniocarpon cinnabarinum]
MPRRRSKSDAASSPGYDITSALVDDEGNLERPDGDEASPSIIFDDSEDSDTSVVQPKKKHADTTETLRSSKVQQDDSEDDDAEFIAAQIAASNRKTSNKPKSSKKSGGFQSLGLNTSLLKAITRKGFAVPTPIQRKTLPLILEGQDVVGMARTGSGKTAAFVIPMIKKLKAHKVQMGARAIVMSPSRELALQSLKAVKEFGRGTDLRTLLIVGGDSLEDQFSQMTSNPDVIIATPGRFLHLLVEMSLDLSSVSYMVFDEADRLFEMGFQAQLTEILHALPASRQTMLFSATLPKSLVEFARAGLKDPQLVRLDAETKISPDLQNAFLTVKSEDKDGALSYLLSQVIKLPEGKAQPSMGTSHLRKRKRETTQPGDNLDPPTSHSTIIFAASQKGVEYLTSLLTTLGYIVSFVYGNLDQVARKAQIENFRSGKSSILVVTDVAARGIDIPMLANVINYDFPAQPKIFVHRVGRTARAGRKGWSYSLIENGDLPYLCDLQLFLGRKLVTRANNMQPDSLAEDIVVGGFPRSDIEPSCEYVAKLLESESDIKMQRTVASRAKKQFLRTRSSASAESAKRAKELAAAKDASGVHPVFQVRENGPNPAAIGRDNLLARISGFRPAETVFEIGQRGVENNATEALRRQRLRLQAKNQQAAVDMEPNQERQHQGAGIDLPETEAQDARLMPNQAENSQGLDEEEFRTSASDAGLRDPDRSDRWNDPENFMTYQPRETNLMEDRGYGVRSGAGQAGFVDAARAATLELNGDEVAKGHGEPSRARWDKRSKKFVARANDEDGSRGQKMITGESGQKLAASFRSGRFEAWKKANRVDRVARPGEKEMPASTKPRTGARHFKHFAERAPKQPDKYRDDYHQKKKRMTERAGSQTPGSFNGKPAKSELRSVEDVRKQRLLKQKRREKTARPSKKMKRK